MKTKIRAYVVLVVGLLAAVAALVVPGCDGGAMPACNCMCGGDDPRAPIYACAPEWYSEGRQCRGTCEAPGQDAWVCSEPPGGASEPWAPPNCVFLTQEADGSRRYCCSCGETGEGGGGGSGGASGAGGSGGAALPVS